MKITKKIVAVILALIMILSTTQIFAGAQFVDTKEIKDCTVYDGDPLTINEVYRVNLGDEINLRKIVGAEYTVCDILSQSGNCVEHKIGYEDKLTAIGYGVAVVEVVGKKDHYDYWGNWDYSEIVEWYCATIIVKDPKGMGEIFDVKVSDQKFRYKESNGFATASVQIETLSDEPVYYATVFVPKSNYADSPVYMNGLVATNKTGSSECKVYVVDATGTMFIRNCTISVRYVWWQWLIKILLFGWIWY